MAMLGVKIHRVDVLFFIRGIINQILGIATITFASYGAIAAFSVLGEHPSMPVEGLVSATPSLLRLSLGSTVLAWVLLILFRRRSPFGAVFPPRLVLLLRLNESSTTPEPGTRTSPQRPALRVVAGGHPHPTTTAQDP